MVNTGQRRLGMFATMFVSIYLAAGEPLPVNGSGLVVLGVAFLTMIGTVTATVGPALIRRRRVTEGTTMVSLPQEAYEALLEDLHDLQKKVTEMSQKIALLEAKRR